MYRMSIAIFANRGKRFYCSSQSYQVRREQSIGIGDWER